MGDKKEAFWKVIVLKTRRAFGKMRRDSKVSWAVGAWLRSRPGPESTSRAWSATRTRGAPPRRQGPERGSDRLRVPSLVEYRAGERPVGPRALLSESRDVHLLHTALIRHPLEDLEEPINVLFCIVKVRRDAHALAAHADEDIVGR